MGKFHKPVLLQESIDYLNIRKGEKYIDATVGGGGHTEAILKKGGIVLGIDFDPEAIKAAREHLSQACPAPRRAKRALRGPSRRSDSTSKVGTSASWRLAQGNFGHLRQIAKQHGFDQVAGIFFDLGVSTYQLEKAGRGFSFDSKAPLDMRMDPSFAVTAADLINGLSKGELNELFSKLAQEKYSRRVANAIVRTRRIRPIKTCGELARTVTEARPKRSRWKKLHPATRVFLALRIAVNDELNNLKKALPQAIELLKPKGRLVVISFHSGEDRIVKQFLKNTEKRGRLRIITEKPVRPTLEEIEKNPRSRSAKLRAAEKK